MITVYFHHEGHEVTRRDEEVNNKKLLDTLFTILHSSFQKLRAPSCSSW